MMLPVCPPPYILLLFDIREILQKRVFFEHLNYLVPCDATQSDVLGSYFFLSFDFRITLFAFT